MKMMGVANVNGVISDMDKAMVSSPKSLRRTQIAITMIYGL